MKMFNNPDLKTGIIIGMLFHAVVLLILTFIF